MGQGFFPASVRLTLDKKFFFLFTPLLQRGVRVPAKVGCSLKSMLGDQFGLDDDYLKERVKTVFLDGKPVDDWDSALVHDRAVLALSAAMPGLAGATLRRGGFFAGLRSQITYREEESPALPEEGWVVVKLFNLLIPELGPLFLGRGILLPPEELAELRENLKDVFPPENIIRGPEGKSGPRPPGRRLPPEGWACLSVRFQDGPPDLTTGGW